MTATTHDAASVETAKPFANHLSDEALLDLVFPPDQQPGGFLRLLSAENEAYLRREQGGWRWPGDSARTLATFIISNSGVDCRFAPVLTTSPTTGGPLLGVTNLWCSIVLMRIPGPRAWPRDGVRPGDRLGALAKFTGTRPAPSVVVDEGDRVSALWVLSTPLGADDPRLVKARRYLAAQVQGDLDVATSDVRRVSFAIPNTLAGSIYPAHTVRAFHLSERAYRIDEFETKGGAR